MIEILKHSLGLCGESHITLWSLFGALGTIFVIFYNYIRFMLINFISLLNRKLKKEK